MERRRRALTGLIALCLALFLIHHARRAGGAPRRFVQPAMGTLFSVTIHGEEPGTAAAAAEEAFALLHAIEADLSRFRDDSLLSAINRAPAELHRAEGFLHDCLRRSLRVSELTGGYFDVTFLPLYRAWDWRNHPTAEPGRATLEALLEKVGYQKISFDEAGRTVRLRPGMMIDFGGVAKGYAVRRMAEALAAAGVRDAIVSGGGDLVITARRPHVIGVQDPEDPARGAIAGRILIEGPAAIFTSGDYEQYAQIGGRRYGHIIDPHTGYPAEGLRSATIVTRDPAAASGLSAGVMAMGRERALAFVESRGIAALLIDASGEVHLSAAFRALARFVPEPRAR